MNIKIWEMYKTSERGEEVINLFSFYGDSDVDVFEGKLEKIFNKFQEEANIHQNFTRLYTIYDNINFDDIYIEENEDAKVFFKRFIEDFQVCLLDQDENGNLIKPLNSSVIIKKKDYRAISAFMDALSINLYWMHPAFFFPIIDNERFDTLVTNCDILGLELPDLPNSTDRLGRVQYYYDLCEAVYDFSIEYDLSPEESCACIYDFATILQDENTIESELPEPTNVWFTGASNNDFKATLKNLSTDIECVWACNEATRRGDIVVMYCLSPQSYIHSIWRAKSDGILNPFSYYHSRITITNPVEIPSIAYSELRTDSYWSKVPIVRKNLQGIKGVHLSARDYQELLRLISSKGFDISKLPTLYSPNIDIDQQNINLEKDVEEKLLIPLLLELGYTDDDWSRELSQKAGRNLKAIPDFVFFPKGDKHFQNAPLVIEAKLTMNTSKDRMNAFNQVLSYGRMMSSELLGLCDKDRLIVYRKKNNVFDRFNPVFEKHWGNLKDPDTFSKLTEIIGKRVISKME